jgi:N-acyl-L-homoserine lactone synthetase
LANFMINKPQSEMVRGCWRFMPATAFAIQRTNEN